MSKDKKTHMVKKWVPYPLVAYGNDGAELGISRLTDNASWVFFCGKYFKKDEVLNVKTIGKNKTQKLPEITCNEKGIFTMRLMPPDLKSYGEIITVEVTRASGEVVLIQYPWGREALSTKGVLGNEGLMQEEDEEIFMNALKKYFIPNLRKDDDV